MRSFTKACGISLCIFLVFILSLPIQAETPPPSEVSVLHQHSGSSEFGGGCYSIFNEHIHDGDEVTGGGCFSPVACGGDIVLKDEEIKCTGTYRSIVLSPDGDYCTFDCTVCGVHQWGGVGGTDVSNWYNDFWKNYVSCQETYPAKVYRCSTCNKQYNGYGSCSVLTGYQLSCTQESYYSLGCNLSTGDVILVLKLERKQAEDYILSVSSEGDSSKIVGYLWQDGSVGSELEVTANGWYKCNVSIDDFGREFQVELGILVTDFDNTPPEIEGINLLVDDGHAVEFEVEASDNYSGVDSYMVVKD